MFSTFITLFISLFVSFTVVANASSMRSLELIGLSDPRAQVLSCSDDSVIIKLGKGTPIPKVGSLFSVTPVLRIDMCTKCDMLVRNVVAVFQKGDKTILKTTKALMNDVLDMNVLSKTMSVSPEIVVESLLNCDDKDEKESITSRTSDLKQQLSVRQAFPRRCSDWFRLDSSGKCVHTGCRVGRGGNTGNCFSCGRSCDNGCSYVPDKGGNVFDYREACCIHDHCYSSSFSRSQCDNEFLEDMKSHCQSLSFFRRGLCNTVANTYFLGVRAGGSSPYRNGQRKTALHNKSPVCSK